MDDLKLYDVEFTSTHVYSGRSVCQAYDPEEAKQLTKKTLEDEGYVTTPGDVYDTIRLDIGEEPISLLLGVV